VVSNAFQRSLREGALNQKRMPGTVAYAEYPSVSDKTSSVLAILPAVILGPFLVTTLASNFFRCEKLIHRKDKLPRMIDGSSWTSGIVGLTS